MDIDRRFAKLAKHSVAAFFLVSVVVAGVSSSHLFWVWKDRRIQQVVMDLERMREELLNSLLLNQEQRFYELLDLVQSGNELDEIQFVDAPWPHGDRRHAVVGAKIQDIEVHYNLDTIKGQGYAAVRRHLPFLECLGAVVDSLLAFVIYALIYIVLAIYMFRELRADFAKERRRTKRLEDDKIRYQAIAQTTQMLAHDVQKPLTMMQSFTQILEHAQDVETMRGVCERFAERLRQSTSYVRRMVADIMYFGSGELGDARNIGEVEDLSIGIKDVLSEIFFEGPKHEITFLFELNHTKRIAIEETKMRRCMVNILDNAVAAMREGGDIWFRSRDLRKSVELTIGNNGSSIGPEIKERIFEAFYTFGKKNGTGLGLAIVNKIATEAGGSVRCQVPKTGEEAYVEFVLTLPASTNSDLLVASLPEKASGLMNSTQGVDPSSAAIVHELENELYSLLVDADRPIRILIVDDEPLYIHALEEQLNALKFLEDKVPNVVSVTTGGDAIQLIETQSFDLLIVDVDLGEDMSGLELVRELRRREIGTLVCLHSNRYWPTDPSGPNLGKILVYPKPMTHQHILSLLIALQRQQDDDDALTTHELRRSDPSDTLSPPPC